MTAYDYKEQRWVEGSAAHLLAVQQLREHVEILEGPRGQDYFEMIRRVDSPQSKEAMLSAARTLLSTMEADPIMKAQATRPRGMAWDDDRAAGIEARAFNDAASAIHRQDF